MCNETILRNFLKYICAKYRGHPANVGSLFFEKTDIFLAIYVSYLSS